MNPILKGAIAFGTVAGVGGASYGIYNAIKSTPEKPKTYSEILKDTLLSTTDETYKDKWEARLTSLQLPNTELVDGLKGLKPKVGADQWKTLRTWCKDIVKNLSKGEQEQEFKNIQNYCTYSIKEKLGKNVIPENGEPTDKWATAHSKLTGITDLNQALTTAKSKGSEQGKEEVKKWCIARYSEPYKGEADPEFKLAQKVCVSS